MLRCTVCLVFVLFTSSVLSPLHAQPTDAPAKKKKKPKNPAFSAVTDYPELPRVLLIGDSISVGYTIPTRKALAKVANVHRPPVNCGPTSKGVAEIEGWLGDKPWDVIHFNWGLHDLKYINADKQLAKPNSDGSSQYTPPDDYEANLRKLVATLKKTGASLIWRNTTPVPTGARGRIHGDAAKYNEIAAKIMKEQGIAIHDMFAFCIQRPEMQQPKNVHFTPEGSQQLANTVAEQIKSALAERKPASK